jgi:hypothetical protein
VTIPPTSTPSPTSAPSPAPPPPFVALMRRYCVDYTARHDLAVCDEIMDPGYTLNMGGHRVAGRDGAYKPAAAKQFAQFPGLGLTVNQVICSGDRLALRFTEHGASVRHGGAQASWGGIGLYRWDGRVLLENFVEQDYFGRRRQLAGDGPDLVEQPAVAPWDTPAVPPDPAAEQVARAWLAAGDLTGVPGVTVDDGRGRDRLISAAHTEVNDLFSAGGNVAFHVCQHGTLIPGEPPFTMKGTGFMHVAGLVTVASGQVTGGRVIQDRLGLMRRLVPPAQAAGAAGEGP